LTDPARLTPNHRCHQSGPPAPIFVTATWRGRRDGCRWTISTPASAAAALARSGSRADSAARSVMRTRVRFAQLPRTR
jgi:hypothetical protein